MITKGNYAKSKGKRKNSELALQLTERRVSSGSVTGGQLFPNS